MNFHYAIPAKNLEESKKFYRKLGFEIVSDWYKPEQELRGINLKKDECRLELVHHPSNEGINFPELIAVLHLGFEVEDLDHALNEVLENGAKIVKPIKKGVSVKQFAFVEDPSGFRIELFEALK